MGDESSAVGPGRRQKEPKTGQQDGQRECLDSEQEEGKLQREGGVLQSSRGPLSPGLQGTEADKPGGASGPWGHCQEVLAGCILH